jgi:hypothetical protein
VLAPQNLEGYDWQVRWLGWSRDTAAMRAFATNVDAARGPVAAEDTPAPADAEAQRRTLVKQTLARSEQRLARVAKSGHPPTTAAAWLLHCDDLDTAGWVDPRPEAFAAAATACRRAMDAWAPIFAERDAAWELLAVAAWRGASASPALKAALEKERRAYSMANVLHRAATGASGAEVLAALRRQPELLEAARLRSGPARTLPTVTDWITAHLAGDSTLEQEARRAFEREDLALLYAIQAGLRPDNKDDQADLAVFKANQPQRTAEQGR